MESGFAMQRQQVSSNTIPTWLDEWNEYVKSLLSNYQYGDLGTIKPPEYQMGAVTDSKFYVMDENMATAFDALKAAMKAESITKLETENKILAAEIETLRGVVQTAKARTDAEDHYINALKDLHKKAKAIYSGEEYTKGQMNTWDDEYEINEYLIRIANPDDWTDFCNAVYKVNISELKA